MSNLDKQPLYVHISEKIQEIIRRLDEGDKLPSEPTLIEQFGCSRSTVRMAIDVLAAKGLIVRKQGVGNIVTKPRLQYYNQEYMSFTEQVEARGLETKTIVKSVKTTADLSVLCKFESDKSFPLINELLVIERFRYVEGHLAIIEYTYLPAIYKHAVNVESIEQNGLYRTLSEHGFLEDFHANEKLTPVILPEHLLEDFSKPPYTPMMLVERTSQNRFGMFEYTKSIIDAEYFSFYRSIKSA